MEITTRRSGAVTIVKLDKWTADNGAAEFRDTIRTLLENGQTLIVLNCVDVLYVDDAEIDEFVKVYKLAHAHGGTVRLVMRAPQIGGWGG